MTDSDTMWRWWHRVTGDHEFPALVPSPPLSFEEVVHLSLDDSQDQE